MRRQKSWWAGAAALGLTAIAVSGARAQVEVLSADRLAEYSQQLPTVTTSATQSQLQAHLKSLQRNASPQAVANAVRVANEARQSALPANAYFAHYSVPTMSPAMRLPDAYPLDGTFGGEVGLVLAQDEYETGSFELYPFEDKAKVELKLSALKNATGDIFPAADLDLKVVKVWYQNGNGWFSYFADPGLTLVPELLLHDESLIRVDTKEKANYARIKTDKGAKEIWISAPQKLNIGFDPYQDGFVDAQSLQPVELKAGEFKQFVLTAHATAETKPGLYKGNIVVTAAGEKEYSIPVAVRVLGFQLPLPKTNYDINKDFVVSLMGAWPGNLDTDSKAFLPTLKNLRAHNILQSGPDVDYGANPEKAAKKVQLMKEAGFLLKPIKDGGLMPTSGANNRPPLSYDQQMDLEKRAKWYREFYTKNFGHSDAFIKSGDEQGVAWLLTQRPMWRIEQRHGMKSYLAGHAETYFPTSGFMLDIRPTAGFPDEADKPNQWKEIGSGYTAFYAGQHNGSENPSFVRRQHGLLGYLSNYDMVDNYQFAYGPWNDRAWDLYKPMVLAYPISDGLVDTLEWDGFREGIDDIRYATKLRQLADEAIASGDLDRAYAGKKVRQWFAEMDGATVDLNAVRLEMIEKIEELSR
jgi:hypothetical protein